MMYNMDNNVRGCPCGKKEEAIPMARKWLSGALAFAMIFGCSAPVALAEETPVEVVEVEQESLEGVEQYTVYAPSVSTNTVTFSKPNQTVEIFVSDVGDDADIDSVVETGAQTSVTYDKDSKKLIFTSKANFNASSDGKTVTVTFKAKQGSTDSYVGTLTFTIKYGAPVTITMPNADSLDDKKLAVGSSTAGLDIKVSTANTAPDVKVTLSDNAKDYFDYTVSKDADNQKTTVKFTAKAVMSADAIKQMTDTGLYPQARIEATSGGVTEKATWTLPFTKAADYTLAPVAITMTASPVGAVDVNKPVSLAVKVEVTDGFGGTKTDDDYPVEWTVNGVKPDDENKIVDSLGNTLATLTPESGITAAKFVGQKAGKYTIEVKAGDVTATRTITVNNADLVYADDADPFFYTDANDVKGSVVDQKIEKNALVGGTVDLSDMLVGAWVEGKISEVGYNISEFGGVLTLSVDSVEAGGSTYKTEAAKGIAKIDGQVITLADSDDTAMAQLLEAAGDGDIIVNIKGSVKYADGSSQDLYNTIRVVIGKPSENVKTIEYYVDGKKVGTYVVKGAADGKDLDEAISLPVMTVGKPVTVSIKVMDEKGYVAGISQRAIFDIKNYDPNDDTVYATIDQNTGVLTPVSVSTGKAYLTIVPVAYTAADKSAALYIEADPNATPEPSPTAAPSPTTEPSTTPEPSPTAAPVVRTGVVVNVSSNLNIRAAANTSSTVVTKVKNGTNLIILGEEGNFYKVQLADGKIGYASKDYVRETTDTPVQPTGDYAIVTTSGGRLNMRQTAGGAVITSIANGTRVDVISEGSEWTLIKYNGRQGYVSTAYLTIYHGAVG